MIVTEETRKSTEKEFKRSNSRRACFFASQQQALRSYAEPSPQWIGRHQSLELATGKANTGHALRQMQIFATLAH
jgi:hypothetical protein